MSVTRFCVLLLALMICFSSSASQSCIEVLRNKNNWSASLLRVYKKFHKETPCVGGKCYNSAYKVAERLLNKEFIHPEKLQVAIAYHRNFRLPNNGFDIYGLNVRGSVEQWRYHAFVVYRGRVLDIYYGNRPSLPSVDKYMFEMFFRERTSEDKAEGLHLFAPEADMLIRLIPAVEYVEVGRRSEMRSRAFPIFDFIFSERQDYPIHSAGNFLSSRDH